MNENETQKNIKVLAIGFGLIVFIATLFFLKDYFFNEKRRNNSISKIENSTEEYTSISSADLFKKINLGEDIVILDLRSEASFEEGHIIDSENLSAANIEKQKDSLDKDKYYFLVDDFGLTPQEKSLLESLAAKELRVSYLEGGYFAWKNGDYPLVSRGDPTSFVDQAKVFYIQAEELKESLLKDDSLYLLDLRTEKDFREGHIKSAVNMGLNTLEKQRKKIPSGKRIILYGNNDEDSFSGAVLLYNMGFFNAQTLFGGLATWREKGFEIVK